MAEKNIGRVHGDIGQRIAEIHGRADRLSPLDIYARMDAIRQAAAESGIDPLDALTHDSAQLPLLADTRPGQRS